MCTISPPQTSRLWQPGPGDWHHTRSSHPRLVITNQTYHSRVICYVGIPNSFFIWSWTTTVCVAGLTSIDNWINRGNNESKWTRFSQLQQGRALSFRLIYHIQVQTIYDGMWSMCSCTSISSISSSIESPAEAEDSESLELDEVFMATAVFTFDVRCLIRHTTSGHMISRFYFLLLD